MGTSRMFEARTRSSSRVYSFETAAMLPDGGKRDRDKVPVVGRPVVAQGRKHGSGLQGVVADLQQVDGHIRGDTFRLVRDDRHTPVPLRFGEIHGHEPLVGVELHRVV